MSDKKELLLTYIKTNVAPILVDFMFGEDFIDAVILPADVSVSELNGHYEDVNFVAPSWFDELKNKKVLVIDRIDNISKDKQLKFCELLKYRKISTFELPDDTVIVITANVINKDTINEEILSLVAMI